MLLNLGVHKKVIKCFALTCMSHIILSVLQFNLKLVQPVQNKHCKRGRLLHSSVSGGYILPTSIISQIIILPVYPEHEIKSHWFRNWRFSYEDKPLNNCFSTNCFFPYGEFNSLAVNLCVGVFKLDEVIGLLSYYFMRVLL